MVFSNNNSNGNSNANAPLVIGIKKDNNDTENGNQKIKKLSLSNIEA